MIGMGECIIQILSLICLSKSRISAIYTQFERTLLNFHCNLSEHIYENDLVSLLKINFKVI